MRLYPKTYENVFTSDRVVNNFDVSRVSVSGLDINEYADLFKRTLRETYDDVYTSIVRIAWLKRRFGYRGKMAKRKTNGIQVDRSFALFSRLHTGMDIRPITRGFVYGKIESYIDDLFPAFDEGNPIVSMNNYKLPYGHIHIDYMTVVYQMDERMLLLKEADDKKMSYNEFLDFVINHIYSLNDDIGKVKYEFVMSNRCAPYVKNNEK